MEDAIQEVRWDEIGERVKKVNPELAAIIDQLSPSKKYSFVKVTYQYGDKILNRGEVQLPSARKTLSLNHADIPTKLKEKLSYSSMPIGLILSKKVEVFFETAERCMPSKLFDTGTLFGLWEAFDPLPSEFVKRVWNLSAGARTVFLLQKVSDVISHNRLKRDFAVHSQPPKKLLDQQQIFKELAQQIDKQGDWRCEILFFSKEWLQEKENDVGFLRLHKYWLSQAWQQSYNCRNQMSYDVAWEEFSKRVSQRNYKPRAQTINIIKHLLTIGEGIFPGFIPVTDENALPLKLIQDAYVNSYLLKQYAPIVMQPHHLRKKDESVYYSLSLPTQLEYTPNARNSPSIITDMRELKNLMDILFDSMKEKQVNYEFFHAENDQFGEIKHVSELPNNDSRISSYLGKYKDAGFCENSQFWRGCIRITLKR